MVPCARCWRLELPCRPFLRAAERALTPREVAEQVLAGAGLEALGEELAETFRRGKAKGEVDIARAGALL